MFFANERLETSDIVIVIYEKSSKTRDLFKPVSYELTLYKSIKAIKRAAIKLFIPANKIELNEELMYNK